jgi:hypothetical protein
MKFLLIAALCTGCANQVQYHGGSSAGLASDQFYCDKEVRSVADSAKREVAMQTCMEGKGWVVKRD